MKLLQNVFLAILLCISVRTTAQIPGYMGKRFLIDAEIQAFPALLTPTASGNHLWNRHHSQSGTYALHSRYGLGLGYVLSRYQLIEVHANYLRTGMKVEMVDIKTQSTRLVTNVLTGLTFDLAYSRTRPHEGHIAPLGKQRAYHIYRTTINGNHNLHEYNRPVPNSLFGSFDAKKTFFGVGYSETSNKVIRDQFLLRYGWRFNFPLNIFLPGFGGGSQNKKTTNLMAFKDAVDKKFLLYDVMQIKMGFGLLR